MVSTTRHDLLDERAPTRGARLGLASLAAATLLASLGTSVANVALPTLTEALGATFSEVQWVVIAYLVASTASIAWAGRLGDRHGRRRLLLAGLTLFVAASALGGAAPSLGLLVAARAVQGVGAALMLALSVALVTDAVPQARAGRAMGLLATTSALGTALGPTLGGALLSGAGWRAVFVVTAPLGLMAWLVARRHLPIDHPSPGPTAALFAVLRHRALRASLAASALVATTMMATLVVAPFYLTRALGLEPILVGPVMSAGPIAAVLTGVPAGRLVDRLGGRRVSVIGLLTMAVGALALATLAVPGAVGWVAPLVVLTVGYALFQTANNTLVMTGVGADRRGAVAGTLGLARNLGLIVGAAAMGAALTLGAGGEDVARALPEAVVQGTRITMGLAWLGVMAALATTRLSARRSP